MIGKVSSVSASHHASCILVLSLCLFWLKRVTACSFAHGRAISCGRLACIVYKDIIEVGSCRDTNISDGAGLSRKTHSAYASVGGCSGKLIGIGRVVVGVG